jgi:acyl-CoA reductase-like NAD-dependent aldehyde dehydrogenase
MSDRVTIAKTYKLFIGGAFPRSESGRSVEVVTPRHGTIANVAHGSRKDVRDAVVAARAAAPKWAGATAYNRGQVLYRLAEMLEARRAELLELVSDAEDLSTKKAAAQVDDAIDTVVWYAGWTDKIAQVYGSTNPVSGPYFNFSVPGPSGVVAVLAPVTNVLSGLLTTICAPLAGGNTVVVIPGSRVGAAVAITVAEAIATSDVPAGVINIITGDVSELGPVLAAHEDVDGLDLAGAGEHTADLAVLAAGTIKRVVETPPRSSRDDKRLRAFLETTTVWHTIGV